MAAVKAMRARMKGRRGKRSPRGQMRRRPAAYPACMRVAMEEAFSKETAKERAMRLRIAWL